MRIQILGTAAAEGWPAIFCGCDTCTRARESGGQDCRSRASIQIDDIFKVDLPPDTHYHSMRFGLELAKLKHLFFSHSHDDHFDRETLNYLKPPFAHNLADPPVNIYGNRAILSAMEQRHDVAMLPIKLVEAKPFVPIRADHLTFTPIRASHMQAEECLNYVIQSDTATVLYASDTGIYVQETVDFLCKQRFDLLIVECTLGKLNMSAAGHMTFDAVLDLRNTLMNAGAVSSDTRVVITHFSHNIGMIHSEIEAVAEPEGIIVAYDGIVLDV